MKQQSVCVCVCVVTIIVPHARACVQASLPGAVDQVCPSGLVIVQILLELVVGRPRIVLKEKVLTVNTAQLK